MYTYARGRGGGGVPTNSNEGTGIVVLYVYLTVFVAKTFLGHIFCCEQFNLQSLTYMAAFVILEKVK